MNEENAFRAYEDPHCIAALDMLASSIFAWANNKGFWDVTAELAQATARCQKSLVMLEKLVKAQKLALITTETSEALEGVRKDADSSIPGFSNEEEEMADQLIRVLDYCGAYGLRIGEAVAAKMAKNEGRPFKHGKMF